MKILSECVPCLLKRVIFESELHNKDEMITSEIIRQVSSLLGGIYDSDVCSAEIATKVHKQVYELLNDIDPYLELKQLSNQVATSLLPIVEELLDTADDRLKTAMRASIVGNILDFGIEGGSKDPHSLKDSFQHYFNEGLGYDDFMKVKKLLSGAQRVVLFTDNCGEIVFDKVLCRELKKAFPMIYLTVVVRGEPIISDATMEDVQEFCFQEVVDKILTTGCFAIGVDFNRLPKPLVSELAQADVILCKGMANYESFSETDYRPIVYLLRSKCTAIAHSMNVSLNKSVIKLYT